MLRVSGEHDQQICCHLLPVLMLMLLLQAFLSQAVWTG